MKRMFCIVLILLLLCAGCGLYGKSPDSVTFYYPRTEILYGAEDGVIAQEERDVSGYTEDLNALLNLYLQGPADENLAFPFPAGTRLLEVSGNGDLLTISLSEEFSNLEGLDLTIASACIGSTCFGLTDVQQICILSGGSIMFTIDRENGIVLFDQLSADATAGSDSQ